MTNSRQLLHVCVEKKQQSSIVTILAFCSNMVSVGYITGWVDGSRWHELAWCRRMYFTLLGHSFHVPGVPQKDININGTKRIHCPRFVIEHVGGKITRWTSVFLREYVVTWRHGRSRDETKYNKIAFKNSNDDVCLLGEYITCIGK